MVEGSDSRCFELAVDAAGEVALDEASCLSVGFAFGNSPGDVGAGARVAAFPGDGYEVQSLVERAAPSRRCGATPAPGRCRDCDYLRPPVPDGGKR